MYESRFIRICFFRFVINDTQIKEKPDENFYKILNDLRGIAVNINQLARVANTYQYIDENKYYPLANKVNDMIDGPAKILSYTNQERRWSLLWRSQNF